MFVQCLQINKAFKYENQKANFELISQKIENALNIYSINISKIESILFNKKNDFLEYLRKVLNEKEADFDYLFVKINVK